MNELPKKGLLLLVLVMGIALMLLAYGFATAKMPDTPGVNFSGENATTKIVPVSWDSIPVAFVRMIKQYTQNIGTGIHFFSPSANGSAGENNSEIAPRVIDSEFEIQEVNVSQGTDEMIVHITSDELQIIPGFEEATQGKDNDSKPWVNDRKVIKDFEGNGTQYDTFVKEVCTGKTLADCFGNNGVLFEYQGHYYSVIHRYYRGPRAPPVDPSWWTTNTS